MTTKTAPGTRTRARRIARRRLRVTRDTTVRRVVGMLLVFAVAFGGVLYRLFDVQVQRADYFAEFGERQRERTIDLSARRGRLYDRDGEVLATSIDAATIYADPRAFRPETLENGLVKPPASDPARTAAALAPRLGREAEWIEAPLTKDAHFVYLGRQLDWELGEQILSLQVDGRPVSGLGRIVEPSRVYPGGGLAGQIVGFTGIDGDGLHGLELQHDSLLKGTPGTLVFERAGSGLQIASGTREVTPPIAGTDLVLTIDREIQHKAEAVAEQLLLDYDAAGAGIVVLEVGSGEVLAMASAPGFDPNVRAEYAPDLWRNRTVTDVFEPGSVQKAITAAAALEEGVVTPETTFLVDDRYRVGNKTFSDAHDHPTEEMTFREIIETSSNVGTIMVAEELGDQRLAEYLDRFGFGRASGVGFPGEAPGLVLPVDQWWTTSLPTIAIGQGVAVTLLQSADFYATIANDGVATQPRIIRGTVGDDGRLAPSTPASTTRVVSNETAQAMQDILTGVVHGERATGKRAAVPGYLVAGKTGTARKPLADARGYSGQYVASFVGFAPADDPQIVVAVMVDEPYPIWGGVVAAPAFSEVMEFTLRHLRVAPGGRAPTIAEVLDAADRAKADAAAQQEGPATAPDAPASPPVGDAADPAASSPQDPAGEPAEADPDPAAEDPPDGG